MYLLQWAACKGEKVSPSLTKPYLPMKPDSLYWLVSLDGRPVRVFPCRSMAIDAVMRAISLRLFCPPFPPHRRALVERGSVQTECGLWDIVSVPFSED